MWKIIEALLLHENDDILKLIFDKLPLILKISTPQIDYSEFSLYEKLLLLIKEKVTNSWCKMLTKKWRMITAFCRFLKE